MCLKTICLCLFFALTFSSCRLQQRKNWSLAIAANNSKYENGALLLKELFHQKNLELQILRFSSSVEAARMVAEGKADFTLELAHSDFIRPKLGEWVKELRTAMPMFENALYLFHRSTQKPTTVIELVENSKIFLEVPDSLSEQYLGLKRVFGMLNVTNYEFVNDSSKATMIPIWGTFSGELTKQMLAKKWSLYSMEDAFIEYALIIEPRFGRLTIPIRYTGSDTKGVSTLLSTAFLISGSTVDRSELYDLIKMIYDNRVFLTSQDKSYMAIREDFSTRNLNFPLHAASSDYLNRFEPTFLERHAEYYGLIVTLSIIAFGIIQSVRNYVARKKKDRIDRYFREFLTIKNDLTLDARQRFDRLETLRLKAIDQMILEKLEILDFNVFNHVIEAERIILKQDISEKKS